MHKISRLWSLVFIFIIFLLISIQTVSAQAAVLNLVTTWLPTEQLSSLDSDTDFTFVDLQFYAQGNVQFWAVEFECVINNGGVFDTTINLPEMVWGPAWQAGNSVDNYFEGNGNGFTAGSNVFKASATRVGATNTSLGLGGANYNLLLFSFRLNLKDTIIGTQTVSISCSKISFFDRNGTAIGKKPKQTNINNLTVRDGYVISGRASRQGNSNSSAIDVDCNHLGDDLVAGNVYSTQGDSNGVFTFDKAVGGSTPLRDYGLYECIYSSVIGGGEQTVYVRGASYLNLQTPQYTLLPVTLRSGDTNNNSDVDIDFDLPLITGNWQSNQPAFTNGDTNGDGLVNQNDLVIAAGNVGLSELVPMDHVLYSAALDYVAPFPNSQIWLGNRYSGFVTGFMIGKGQRLFMPQMSPDGSMVAFVSAISNKKTKETNHTVQVTSSSSFKAVSIFGKGYVGQDFSPSWSPDGDTLAYVCSWSSEIDGYQLNNGNLCLIGANGNPAPSKIIPTGQLQSYAKIFPPAWYDSNVVVYGGNDDSDLCSNELCFYDIANNLHGKITIAGVDGSSAKADMPSIVRFYTGATFLIYRYRSGSTTELRMATVEYSAGTWTGGIQSANGTNLQHETVNNSAGVAYYDVSQILDIMFYKFKDFAFTNLYFSSGADFDWDLGDIHMIDGLVGYPTASIPSGFGEWDESDSTGTEFHIYKPTFDWLP